MKQTVELKWLEKFAFESEIDGHKIAIDMDESRGGKDKGPRPKPLMLLALGGCTAIDVISILNKMRVHIEDLNIKVEADLTDEHPKTYSYIKVIYEFKGKDLPMEKLDKAVKLSEEKYCGVGVFYKRVIRVDSEIRIV